MQAFNVLSIEMNYLKADVPTGLVNPGPPAHLGGRVAAAAPLLRFILSV